MTLNIDNLLPSQRPAADQDISVQWGSAVEADIRALNSRANAPFGPKDSVALSYYYTSYNARDVVNGSPWSGTRTACNVYDGKLYPDNTTFFDGVLNYDNGDNWDNWVTSYSYQTNAVVLNAPYVMDGRVTFSGNYLYGPATINGEYLNQDTVTWTPLPGQSAGPDTFVFEKIVTNEIRFTITVPQASTGQPSYLSGFSVELFGPQYGESLVVDVPFGGVYVGYQHPYPLVPGAAFFPFYQAGQRLRADVSDMTNSGCKITLVTDDGIYTPCNGRGLLMVSLGNVT